MTSQYLSNYVCLAAANARMDRARDVEWAEWRVVEALEAKRSAVQAADAAAMINWVTEPPK